VAKQGQSAKLPGFNGVSGVADEQTHPLGSSLSLLAFLAEGWFGRRHSWRPEDCRAVLSIKEYD
jgi:hypothetical protein